MTAVELIFAAIPGETTNQFSGMIESDELVASERIENQREVLRMRVSQLVPPKFQVITTNTNRRMTAKTKPIMIDFRRMTNP